MKHEELLINKIIKEILERDRPSTLMTVTSLLVLAFVTRSLMQPGKLSGIRTLITQQVKLYKLRYQLRKSKKTIQNSHRYCTQQPACGCCYATLTRSKWNMTVRIINEIDVDGDGKPDIVTADTNGGDVFISVKWILAGAAGIAASIAGYLLMV